MFECSRNMQGRNALAGHLQGDVAIHALPFFFFLKQPGNGRQTIELEGRLAVKRAVGMQRRD